MANPNIIHAYQQRHLSSPAADWRNTVARPDGQAVEAPEEAPEAPSAPTLMEASGWSKSNLVELAGRSGVPTYGTKADLLARLVDAGFLTA